jgi:hypothetical protein
VFWLFVFFSSFFSLAKKEEEGKKGRKNKGSEVFSERPAIDSSSTVL